MRTHTACGFISKVTKWWVSNCERVDDTTGRDVTNQNSDRTGRIIAVSPTCEALNSGNNAAWRFD